MLKRDVDEHCSKHRPERRPDGQTFTLRQIDRTRMYH